MYAVIRIDEFLGPDCPVEEIVTVKEVVASRDEAVREVDRLNGLRKPGVRYFWQLARLAWERAQSK